MTQSLLFTLTPTATASSRRASPPPPRLHRPSLMLVAAIVLANIWVVGWLIAGLVQGTEGRRAGLLLLAGTGFWLANLAVFSLWYWRLDRHQCPREGAGRPYPDFLFPQMGSPDLAPNGWKPAYADYLYLSFTNATAFSPTDVVPLSRCAKLTMMLQSAMSWVMVVFVIAWAVNILT